MFACCPACRVSFPEKTHQPPCLPLHPCSALHSDAIGSPELPSPALLAARRVVTAVPPATSCLCPSCLCGAPCPSAPHFPRLPPLAAHHAFHPSATIHRCCKHLPSHARMPLSSTSLRNAMIPSHIRCHRNLAPSPFPHKHVGRPSQPLDLCQHQILSPPFPDARLYLRAHRPPQGRP